MASSVGAEVHEADKVQDGGALQTAKDLFSGAAGGITQVLVGTHSRPERSNTLPHVQTPNSMTRPTL